jgi:hypothetical protein
MGPRKTKSGLDRLLQSRTDDHQKTQSTRDGLTGILSCPCSPSSLLSPLGALYWRKGKPEGMGSVEPM